MGYAVDAISTPLETLPRRTLRDSEESYLNRLNTEHQHVSGINLLWFHVQFRVVIETFLAVFLVISSLIGTCVDTVMTMTRFIHRKITQFTTCACLERAIYVQVSLYALEKLSLNCYENGESRTWHAEDIVCRLTEIKCLESSPKNHTASCIVHQIVCHRKRACVPSQTHSYQSRPSIMHQ